MKNTNQYYQNNENLRFTMVTAEQEKELFLAAKAGDSEAREFLIKNHLLFCANFGRKRNKGALPEDEVISAVNEALMKAVDSFDPGYGSRFTRYLVPFLRGALANLWKSKNIVRVPTPKDPEFSSQSRFSTFDDAKSVANIRIALPDSYGEQDNLGKNRTGCNVASTMLTEDLGEEIEQEDFNRSIQALLAQCRDALTSEERDLLTEVYDRNRSYTDIAASRKPPVSRQAIQQAHNRIIAKLKEALLKRSK